MRSRISLVVLTGAGISAESGVPTFRDAGGLWEGHSMEDVATPGGWERDPALVWRFYQLRRARLREVHPNAAHLALARLEKELRDRKQKFLLITQNVDDLHERAGSTFLAMHGSLSHLRCDECGGRTRDLEHLDPAKFVPCGRCGGRMRPDVVWFGEVPHHLAEIQAGLRECTDFWAIGTSGVVYPAAGFLQVARAIGANTCVNCLEEPENLHAADRFEKGPAGSVAPRLVEEILVAVDSGRSPADDPNLAGC